jgi:aspartate/methionine/tyrosine aminotransferase
MTSGERVMRSEYMEWAKAKQSAKYTLALSGIKPMTLDELGAGVDDIALGGPIGYGCPELLSALAAKSGVPESHIVLAAGTSGGNHLAFASLIEPGDEVVMETPLYEPMQALAEHLGGIVRHFPRRHENGFRIDPDDVAKAVTPRTKVIVYSNLHNPAPAMVGEQTVKAIGEIAARAGATVVADEVYLDAAFEQAPRSSGQLGPVFVVTTSLTKVFGLGGLRAGWIVAEPERAARMRRLKNLFGVDGAHPAERLAVFALKDSRRILARTKSILDTNRAAWFRFLDRHPELETERPTIGTTSFPKLISGSPDRLCEILREKYETSLVPGRCFGAPEHFRIGLCGDTAVFPEGLDRLGQALDDLRRGA